MKTSKDWETQMSHWIPRQPSDRLTRTIFGPSRSKANARPKLVDPLCWAELALRQWAVGLASCLALLVALHPGKGGAARVRLEDRSIFPLLSVLSNQQSAAYHSIHAHSEWNHCARVLLEWTNTLPSPSSMPSFSARKAN